MKLEGKKHIFFDLDHTLWDFEKNSALAFRDIFEAHEVVVDHDAFIRAYVPINVRYWKLFRDGDIDQQQLRYGRFREAFAEVG
ncbi:haloacid dehalogenase, partial [Nostoc linckia z15]